MVLSVRARHGAWPRAWLASPPLTFALVRPLARPKVTVRCYHILSCIECRRVCDAGTTLQWWHGGKCLPCQPSIRTAPIHRGRRAARCSRELPCLRAPCRLCPCSTSPAAAPASPSVSSPLKSTLATSKLGIGNAIPAGSQPGSTSPDLGRPQVSPAFRPPDHTTRYIIHMLGCLLVALRVEPHKERSSRHALKVTWQLLRKRCTSIGALCKAHRQHVALGSAARRCLDKLCLALVSRF